jgi:hypothetical protein
MGKSLEGSGAHRCARGVMGRSPNAAEHMDVRKLPPPLPNAESRLIPSWSFRSVPQKNRTQIQLKKIRLKGSL